MTKNVHDKKKGLKYIIIYRFGIFNIFQDFQKFRK
jgi:hypothetical protein